MRIRFTTAALLLAGCRTLGTTTPPATEPKAVGPVAGKAAKVNTELTMPIKHVTGLATRRLPLLSTPGDAVSVVAVGDASAVLAYVRMEDKVTGQLDLKEVPSPAPKWEGVASSDSQLYLLDGTSGRIVVTNGKVDGVEQTIALDFAKLGPFKQLGEGLILLKNGHVVVLVGSAPAQLVELGPDGEAPLGIAPGMVVEPGEGFPLVTGAQRTFVPLKAWRFDDQTASVMGGFRELTIGPDQQLYLLSDKRIGRLAPKIRTFDDEATVRTYWDLPAGLTRPAGLAFAGEVPVVAGDEKVQLLEPLED